MIRTSLTEYCFTPALQDSIVTELLSNTSEMETFIMRFHHQMPESACTASRAYISALTISAGYLFGGLIPLMPYFIANTNHVAFMWSVAVMVVALFLFGFGKTMVLGEGKKWVCCQAGVQMVLLGGVAAAAAMGSVKAIGGG